MGFDRKDKDSRTATELVSLVSMHVPPAPPSSPEEKKKEETPLEKEAQDVANYDDALVVAVEQREHHEKLEPLLRELSQEKRFSLITKNPSFFLKIIKILPPETTVDLFGTKNFFFMFEALSRAAAPRFVSKREVLHFLLGIVIKMSCQTENVKMLQTFIVRFSAFFPEYRATISPINIIIRFIGKLSYDHFTWLNNNFPSKTRHLALLASADFTSEDGPTALEYNPGPMALYDNLSNEVAHNDLLPHFNSIDFTHFKSPKNLNYFLTRGEIAKRCQINGESLLKYFETLQSSKIDIKEFLTHLLQRDLPENDVSELCNFINRANFLLLQTLGEEKTPSLFHPDLLARLKDAAIQNPKLMKALILNKKTPFPNLALVFSATELATHFVKSFEDFDLFLKLITDQHISADYRKAFIETALKPCLKTFPAEPTTDQLNKLYKFLDNETIKDKDHAAAKTTCLLRLRDYVKKAGHAERMLTAEAIYLLTTNPMDMGEFKALCAKVEVAPQEGLFRFFSETPLKIALRRYLESPPQEKMRERHLEAEVSEDKPAEPMVSQAPRFTPLIDSFLQNNGLTDNESYFACIAGILTSCWNRPFSADRESEGNRKNPGKINEMVLSDDKEGVSHYLKTVRGKKLDNSFLTVCSSVPPERLDTFVKIVLNEKDFLKELKIDAADEEKFDHFFQLSLEVILKNERYFDRLVNLMNAAPLNMRDKIEDAPRFYPNLFVLFSKDFLHNNIVFVVSSILTSEVSNYPPSKNVATALFKSNMEWPVRILEHICESIDKNIEIFFKLRKILDDAALYPSKAFSLFSIKILIKLPYEKFRALVERMTKNNEISEKEIALVLSTEKISFHDLPNLTLFLPPKELATYYSDSIATRLPFLTLIANKNIPATYRSTFAKEVLSRCSASFPTKPDAKQIDDLFWFLSGLRMGAMFNLPLANQEEKDGCDQTACRCIVLTYLKTSPLLDKCPRFIAGLHWNDIQFLLLDEHEHIKNPGLLAIHVLPQIPRPSKVLYEAVKFVIHNDTTWQQFSLILDRQLQRDILSGIFENVKNEHNTAANACLAELRTIFNEQISIKQSVFVLL